MSSINENIFGEIPIRLDSFKKLLPDFFEEIQDDFNLLKQHFQQKDLTQIRLIAHKIKGSAASYSALLINTAAFHIQECIDLKQNDQLKEFVDALEQSIETSLQFAKEELDVD